MLVSFVIATYNRSRTLVDCLGQLQANVGLAAGAYEILVVDNASTDQTAALAAEVPHVRLLGAGHNYGPVAKNFGIAQAVGEFVVVLDDDAFPLPGAVEAMLGHFAEAPGLGAAVFDVMLPDGSREASAYPDVFIGAGTGFRRQVIQALGGLPLDFFMQAEEYDLSFRLLRAGYAIRRFADMPLRHLKAPGARIGTRTTRLDVRNNLYLLAKYLPAPLCHQFAADWLSRYWMMAAGRDRQTGGAEHRAAYVRGAAEGLARWPAQRAGGRHVLPGPVIERIFKFEQIRERLVETFGTSRPRVLFADFGKNMLAFYQAARELGLPMVAIADDGLAAGAGQAARKYRGVPILAWRQARACRYDAIVVSNLSPVQAPARAAALREIEQVPVLECLSGRADEGSSGVRKESRVLAVR